MSLIYTKQHGTIKEPNSQWSTSIIALVYLTKSICSIIFQNALLYIRVHIWYADKISSQFDHLYYFVLVYTKNYYI